MFAASNLCVSEIHPVASNSLVQVANFNTVVGNCLCTLDHYFPVQNRFYQLFGALFRAAIDANVVAIM